MAPKLRDILSESKRIISANPRHYLTLTLIFLLPLSFSSLIFQLLLIHFQQQQQLTTLLFLSLFYSLFFSLFSFCAISSITYSVYHTFFNKPIKLQEALKSITTSFFPLLATTTIFFVIFFFIFFIFGLVLFLIFIVAIQHVDDLTTKANLVALCTSLLMLVLFPVVVYVQIYWSLVTVIVVVESRWGLEPLRRSASLMKGMKRLIVSSFAFFGIFQGIFFGIYYYYKSTSLVVIFVICPFSAMLMLFQLAVNTVLYIYCKQNLGELEEDNKLGREEDNVSLSLIPS